MPSLRASQPLIVARSDRPAIRRALHVALLWSLGVGLGAALLPGPARAQTPEASARYRATGFYETDPKTRKERLVALVLVPAKEPSPKVLTAREIVSRELKEGRLTDFGPTVKTLERTELKDQGRVRAIAFSLRTARGPYAKVVSDLFLGKRIFVFNPEARDQFAGGAGGGGGGGGAGGAGGGGGH